MLIPVSLYEQSGENKNSTRNKYTCKKCTPNLFTAFLSTAEKLHKKTKNHPSIKNIQKLKYTKEKIHKEKIHSIIFSHKKENHFLWIFYTVEKKVVDFFYRCLNLFCPLMTRNRSLVNKLNTIIFSPYTLHIDRHGNT